MITRQEILDRVKILARLIHEDCGKERPVMVCILKGANPVCTTRFVDRPHFWTIYLLTKFLLFLCSFFSIY